jgi:hypothetical protein
MATNKMLFADVTCCYLTFNKCTNLEFGTKSNFKQFKVTF